MTDSALLELFHSLTCLGELQSVDGYMNIALEKTEEYVNGQLRRKYGDAFVRGNNGIVSRKPQEYVLTPQQLCISPRTRRSYMVSLRSIKAAETHQSMGFCPAKIYT